MSSGNDDFEQRVKADLRRIIADTSPELRTRISGLVAAAMRERRESPRRFRPVLLPLGGVAALAVAIVAVQMLRPGPAAVAKPAAIPAGDVALLLNIDNLDLLEQMEFYLWLDREPGVLDAAGAKAPETPRRS